MADVPIRPTAPAGDGIGSGSGVEEGVVVAVGPVTSDPSFRTGLRVGGGSRMGLHPWPTQKQHNPETDMGQHNCVTG